jgi:ubiquinone/menaquinone biosynthesis C-methylase UbiE
MMDNANPKNVRYQRGPIAPDGYYNDSFDCSLLTRFPLTARRLAVDLLSSTASLAQVLLLSCQPFCKERMTTTNSTDIERIRGYYSRFREWERLDSPSGVLEFRRACGLFEKYLPSRARILDLGGGPGRYAIHFAQRGHRVVLADLSSTLLDVARLKISEAGVSDRIEGIDEVEAQDLSRYPDRRFDAVVAFGPYYHLASPEERETATREIRRVLAPGGLAFTAFIPRLNGLVSLLERAANFPAQVPVGTLKRAAATGVFRNGAVVGFQEGYYATPLEIRTLFEKGGFELLDLVSLRSLGNAVEQALLRIDMLLQKEVEEMLDTVARLPEVVATAGHAVLVARRRVERPT